MKNPFVDQILSAFPESDDLPDATHLTITDNGDLPSWFETSNLAAASIGCAGLMAARLISPDHAKVIVDKALASAWFGMTLHPLNWSLPSLWDPLAGDYRTADGWIRLHTNAPHHRLAALSVLGPHEDRASLEPVVDHWTSDELEQAIVDAGGCAASMMSLEEWARHPQGITIAGEPLIHWDQTETIAITSGQGLAGIKVLDLTRVLAGPVATRFLAGYGADVLRIDPPDWDEPGVVPEVTLGKRCAGLDLKTDEDRTIFKGLVRDADVLVHGYRPTALDNLGFDPARLHQLNPGLITVALCAYGWTGPWAQRRGFDSLVQMSTGIADHGMRMSGVVKPTPLPVQALDHATGYFLAASVLYALHQRATRGTVLSARMSLAKTADSLGKTNRTKTHDAPRPITPEDYAEQIEATVWGPAHRINFPVKIDGVDASWPCPAGPLRSAPARW